MKVLFVVNQMSAGGIERLLLDMASRLKELGHDPVVVSMASSGSLYGELSSRGIAARSITNDVKDLGFFKPKMISRLRRLIKDEAPDVVHLCDIISGHIGRMACLWLGVTIVYALHSMVSHRKLKYRIASRLFSYVTDHYVAVSREVWDKVGVAQNLAGSAYTIIHNGVEVAKFDEALPLDVSSLFAGKTGPVIVSCGRLVPLKNIDLLICSFAKLLQELPEALLLIIGDGPERARLEKLADTPQLAGHVCFTGFRTDVPAVLKGLAECRAVMAMPSEYEGFSVAFAEALYCGLPVVISEQAAPKDVSGPGVVYCSLDQDSLKSALCGVLDGEAYGDLAKGARELGRHLTITNTIEEHLSVYTRLIEGKRCS